MGYTLRQGPAAPDFLIVGQGLAGSLLAWNLIRRDRRVRVVDDHHRGASSTVAAGLINPITGMRLTLDPQEAGDSLLRSLEQLVPAPKAFTVTGQQAGIRPATLDTQPFVGLLPGQPGIGAFNGFGSKGSLMIPWHARRFAAFLDGRAELPAWAHVTRHTGMH